IATWVKPKAKYTSQTPNNRTQRYEFLSPSFMCRRSCKKPLPSDLARIGGNLRSSPVTYPGPGYEDGTDRLQLDLCRFGKIVSQLIRLSAAEILSFYVSYCMLRPFLHLR
ncbi:uncharacterized protein METZ01_LOCUS324893, partial [marine metagenome]